MSKSVETDGLELLVKAGGEHHRVDLQCACGKHLWVIERRHTEPPSGVLYCPKCSSEFEHTMEVRL